MPWPADREARRRSDATYQDPEYKANRALARRRADGRCEQCHHPHARLQCDHITPVSQGGTHAVSNLQMLCVRQGSCKCHEKKTAQEGNAAKAGAIAAPTPDPAPTPKTAW